MTFSLSHILSQQTYSATLFIRPCLMLLVLVCGTLGLSHIIDIRHVLEGEALAQQTSGYVLFLGVVTLWCSFGLPRQVVGFIAGLTYGIVVGFIIITIASTCGYLAGFLWARWGGRCWVRAQCGKRFASLDRFITDQPFLSILTLRLLPVGSALLVNFLGGVSSMRVMPFVGATVLGALPQNIITVLLGAGVQLGSIWRYALGGGLFVVSSILGVWLCQRFRFVKALSADEG
ncbi:MAG: TVP38/TMEM64 family protein [Acetobacter sp.]|nr:TVP38/TMEM64 family protein [Acetobacter sp.]